MQEYLIGIDVGGTNTKIMVMDTHFNVLGEQITPTNLGATLEENSAWMIVAIDTLFEKNGIHAAKIRGIGMGVPGLVDFHANRTVYLPLHHWDGVDPCDSLAKHYNTVSFVDNDANVNALGEYYFGEGSEYRSLVYLTVGTGLGGAAIINGSLLRGKGNAAAEVGHMTVFAEGGRPCVCGKTGCLEPYCSGTELLRLAKESAEKSPDSVLACLVRENGGKLDNRLVSQAAEMGDRTAEALLKQIGRYLGIGVANLMKLFDPDVVFIGGGVSNAGEALLEPVRRTAEEYIMYPAQACPVRRATLGMRAGMFGAAAMAALNTGLDPLRGREASRASVKGE